MNRSVVHSDRGGAKAFVAGADIAELAQCDVQKAVKKSMLGLYLTQSSKTSRGR